MTLHAISTYTVVHVLSFYNPLQYILESRVLTPLFYICLHYYMTVRTEPRKIAHRILNAREDVAGEMINDLGCISLENEEVQRYAGVWAKDGREAAEKSRKVTRMRGQGGSTPLRDRNYLGLSVFVSQRI